MKFAIVNNTKTEATKGVKGICPSCGSELIAKCGELKINHWAHKGNRTCDPWWESETEWHRSWKNNYPKDWQEFVLLDDKTAERHIADVRTANNLVIEFQHSHIDPNERATREKFYKNIIWVVDGTRLKRDYPRFLKNKKDFRSTGRTGIFLVDYLDEVFPLNWINSSVPVVFDFKGLQQIDNPKDERENLYCLFQVRLGRYGVLSEISRKAFIETTINGEWTTRVQKFLSKLIQPKQEQKEQEARQQLTQANIIARRREPQWFLDRGKWKRRRRL